MPRERVADKLVLKESHIYFNSNNVNETILDDIITDARLTGKEPSHVKQYKMFPKLLYS